MKKRVTFEVDDIQLFDRLKEIGGDTDALGARLVTSLFGLPNFAEAVGMGTYGVTYVGEEPVAAEAPSPEPYEVLYYITNSDGPSPNLYPLKPKPKPMRCTICGGQVDLTNAVKPEVSAGPGGKQSGGKKEAGHE